MKEPKLGDTAYEVEWLAKPIPVDENGDGDFDRAEYAVRYVASLAAARALAKKVFNNLSGVQITRVELVDPFGDGIRRTFIWEARGTSEWYEGETVSPPRLGFAVGDRVHVNQDNEEWGRIAHDGTIKDVTEEGLLVEVDVIRAAVLFRFEEVSHA